MGYLWACYICKMKFRYILLFACVGLLFAACRKDLNDEEKPVAEFLQPDTNNLTFSDTIPLTVHFTDNKGLLAYRVAINYASTGTIDTTNAKVFPMSLTWIGDVEGEEFTKEFTFFVTDSTLSGPYRAVVTCVDEAGKQSAPDTVLFNLRNLTDTIPPEITLALPANNQQYSTTDSLNVLASVYDANNVIYYAVSITDTAGVVKTQTSDNVDADAYTVDKMVGLAGLSPGAYYVTLYIRDAYFNNSAITVQIQIN
jgi:hypothetical protein